MAEMNLRHSISMDFFTLSASDNMHATTNYLSTPRCCSSEAHLLRRDRAGGQASACASAEFRSYVQGDG